MRLLCLKKWRVNTTKYKRGFTIYSVLLNKWIDYSFELKKAPL